MKINQFALSWSYDLTIICEIKRCKYYSVSLDSTPDISHVDQLTLIERYVFPSGPVEFVKFLDMEGHTAEQLAQSLLDFLSETGYINISKIVVGKATIMPVT